MKNLYILGALCLLAMTTSCSGKYSYEWEYNFLHGKKKNQDQLACVSINHGQETYTGDGSGCVPHRYASDPANHVDTGTVKNI